MPTPRESDFGGLLRGFRQDAGKTQRELADLAGLSTGAIRDLEQGRSRGPKPDSIEAITTALALNSEDSEKLRTAVKAGRAVTTSTTTDVDGPLRIRVLGPLDVRHGEVSVPIGAGPQRILLARLALAAGTTVSQAELIDLLWPNDVPHNVANLLQTRVARLRRLLETGGAAPEVIVGSPSGYRLAAAAESLDLLAFRALTTDAVRDDPEVALSKLAEAVELWRGLIDVEVIDSSPLYVAISNEYAATVRDLAGLARDLGEPERALSALRNLAGQRELDEPLHVELIRTLAAADRQAEALATYDRIRSALAGQLGVDPGEGLRAAHLEVLRPGAPELPGLAVVQQTPSAPPDFVGRADELTTIGTALGRPGATCSRVVLINGIAGVGKTALALAAAHQLRAQYPDGQLYADLRGADAITPEPIQILGRFLRALGVPGRRIGTDAAEASALLRSELADRRMLILLDNAQDAAQIRPLLPGAGGSDVLVTCRRRLPDLATTYVVDLEPLPHDDAVLLITATAGTRRLDGDRSGVSALAEACARLPLALRIAGARLATRRQWTVADLANRLEDGNRKLTELSLGESSVLSSFDLSYADLSADAQRAFRLCSLHPGDDFSAESAGVLLGIPVAAADRVLEVLLEANMLLQHTKDRFRFHDLLGLYSRRLLAEDAEGAAARTRLNAWYVEAVTAAINLVHPQLVRLEAHPAPETFFRSKADALAWLDAEAPALLAVVKDPGHSDSRSLSWRIVDQLRGYFLLRRDVDGWLLSAQAGLAAAEAAGDDAARVAMLINHSQAVGALGRDEEGLVQALTAYSLAVEIGWPAAAAYLAYLIGWFHQLRGKLADADLWNDRALDLTENDHGHLRAIVLNSLGMTRLYQGELQKAADLFGAALQTSDSGPEWATLTIRGNLASAVRQLGEADRAAALLNEVLDAYHRRSYLRGELSTLDEMAKLYAQRGDGPAALQAALRAYELSIAVRDPKAQAQTASTVAHVHLALGDVPAAVQWVETCLPLARTTYPYLEAEALITLSAARQLTGDQAAATEAAEQAAAIAAACGFRLVEDPSAR
ncbi:BTAD domain-containing putative transcriptional regulator [Kribbella antibiotica]|uniref:BTAD domain-containing putative transcriptional regulator n=1 Tax=Kribbella antibiotica TaxID=190195 RepID=UPI0014047E5E|nr:BTAD domain-containing putative transcriptional regulator [Kribbella antibiotica]